MSGGTIHADQLVVAGPDDKVVSGVIYQNRPQDVVAQIERWAARFPHFLDGTWTWFVDIEARWLNANPPDRPPVARYAETPAGKIFERSST
jgi:hypothetical protein